MKLVRPPQLAAVTASLALAVSLAACAPANTTTAGAPSGSAAGADCASGPVTGGYVPKQGSDPYMTTVRDGAEEAAKAVGGKVVYTSPSEATGPAQIPFVNQLISQKVGVIAISGSNLNSSAAALKKARAAGIKVLSFDSDIAPDARSLFINQADTKLIGENMLDSMYNMIKGQGEFGILSATQTSVNQNAWIAGMKDRLSTDSKFAKMKLVTIAYGQEKADVNSQQARQLVQTYPNLKGIIVPAGIGLPAAAEALSQTGDLGRIKLTGLAPPTLIKKYIVSGDVQDTWWNVKDLGYLSYVAAQQLAQCKVTGAPGESINVGGDLGSFKVGEKGQVILGPPVVVTPKNVNDFAF